MLCCRTSAASLWSGSTAGEIASSFEPVRAMPARCVRVAVVEPGGFIVDMSVAWMMRRSVAGRR
jgi:hypothetical protein